MEVGLRGLVAWTAGFETALLGCGVSDPQAVAITLGGSSRYTSRGSGGIRRPSEIMIGAPHFVHRLFARETGSRS